ncbi:MAG: hypothetical protein J5530_06195, partial [Clostridia bacterium]|nr:hypothetical protein [Clostridia bacterium]
MRINRTRRIISLLLLLCVTAFSLSFSVFADRAPEKPQDAGADHAAGSVIDQNLVAAEMQEKAGQGILEIESLREESSKHFQLEDGSYQAIAYGAAVHRMDADGKWRDIDNRLYA